MPDVPPALFSMPANFHSCGIEITNNVQFAASLKRLRPPVLFSRVWGAGNESCSWFSVTRAFWHRVSWVGDPDWPAISNQLHRTLDLSGFIGGAQAGYNVQNGNIVFGAEVDFNWLDASKSYQTPVFAGVGGGTWDASGSATINWLATLRARVGVTSGNALFYLTGGLALADTEFRQRVNFRNVPPPPPVIPVPRLPLTNAAGGSNDGSGSEMQIGFTLGAGVEWALDRNWSLKGEYLYVGMGSDSASSSYTSPVNGLVYVINHNNKFESLNIARVGLNYKF